LQTEICAAQFAAGLQNGGVPTPSQPGPLLSSLFWETWYNGRNLTADEHGYIFYENKLHWALVSDITLISRSLPDFSHKTCITNVQHSLSLFPLPFHFLNFLFYLSP